MKWNARVFVIVLSIAGALTSCRQASRDHGEVVVFAGEQEITVRDKRLAALLYHATR